jgi:gamma-glutamyl hercynylcysteine S-oxide synthase
MHAMKNNPRGNRHTLLNRLPPELKRLPPVTPRTIGPEVTPEQVAIPAGTVTLGRSRTDTHGFGWDNECEAQSVEVSVFAIDRYPVSNGDYLEFMVAGGYEEPAF